MSLVRPSLPLLALAALAVAPSVAAAPRIGVLLKGRGGFWTPVERGALAAGQKLGADVVVKAPIDENDVAVQIRLLAALGAQGIQALVVAPANAQTLAGPVAALAARGVKIVVIDSPLDGTAPGPFVGTDQLAAGAAAGRLLASLLGENGEVSVLKHSQNSVAARQREAGALAALRSAHPHLVVHSDIYASSEAGAEGEHAALLLAKYPATRAILASGTPGTMAMLRLLEARKAGGPIPFVGFGFDLNPAVAAALADGTMQGWVAQLPADVGYQGVAAALALTRGEAVAPNVATAFIAVTRANLHEPRIEALLAGS
jgi:ribose transport system substrate-binding protein